MDNIRDSLITCLREEHELIGQRWPGLRSRPDPVVTHPEEEIPDYGDKVIVTRANRTISWSYETPDYVSDRTSLSSSQKFSVTPGTEYKIRHEFVAEAIESAATDVSIGKAIKKCHDDDDVLTPDFIFRDDNGDYYVIELGTTKATGREQVRRVYEDKLFKYDMALRSRATDCVIIYSPLIVCPNYIMFSCPLPHVIVFELLNRMAISLAVENIALSNGIDLKLNEEDTVLDKYAKMIHEVISDIKNISKSDDDHLYINNDHINQCLKEPIPHIEVTRFLECKSSIPTDLLDKERSSRLLKAYVDKISDPTTNRRNGMKAVIQMPLCLAKVTDQSTLPSFHCITARNCPAELSKIWQHALSCMNRMGLWKTDDKTTLLKEAYETDTTKIEKLENDRRTNKVKYHRVDMSPILTGPIERYLNKDGLFAKKTKDTAEYKLRREYQRSSFNYKTQTDDITKFLSNKELFEITDERTSKSCNLVNELLNAASDIAGNKKVTADILISWSKTKYFRAMDIISDIATELAVSIKQNTRQGEFILKKLLNYDVYILIKTTNSDSHLFYSLYYPSMGEEDILDKTVFRSLHKLNRGFVTDFLSVRKDKLVNYINATSRLISLVSFWVDFYHLSDFSPKSVNNSISAVRMLNLSMLISLENKAETEESITLTRYMYMEIFKFSFGSIRPDPFKVLSKFTTKPRSRLNLWCIHMIIQNFSSMQRLYPRRRSEEPATVTEEGEEGTPGDRWDHLLNCFTGESISSSTNVVNLMYLGYLKDKNEQGQGNSEWPLVKKIVEEEIKMKRIDIEGYKGNLGEKDRPKSKQFSMNSMAYGCSLMEKKFNSILGSQWRKVLTSEILNNLSRQLTHEIATLKASANIPLTSTNRTYTKDDLNKTTRVKVIEALAAKLDHFGLNPFLYLDKILELVENTAEGVICDIFKKNQHGGLREIYVLTIHSRILQLFIETISRTICSYFEEETLTHPENKLKILDRHKVKSAKHGQRNNSIYADVCSSSDKTRWNQNFTMLSLGVPLFRLTEPIFHNAIQRILNLWSNKLIKLPPAVMKLLVTKTCLTDETYMKLMHKFNNFRGSETDYKVLKKVGSPFLNTTSGFMQGILHYSSSLLHLCCLFANKAITLRYLFLKYKNENYKFSMSSVCSSDDSATIISVFTEKDASQIKEKEIRAVQDAILCLQASTIYCNYFSMVESVKSTVGMCDYVEFNSEFIFKNTVAMPIIKFVSACTNISESESFTMRSFESYNLITDLYGSGFPSMNTSVCQLAQGILHYRTMGANTSVVFEDYVDKILGYPDVTHGFFLLDNEFVCGLMGLSFSRWCAMRSCPLLMGSIKCSNFSEMEVGPDGSIVDSLNMKHGQLYRWYKMLDRIALGQLVTDSLTAKKDLTKTRSMVNKVILKERTEMMNSNPELLFRHPNSVDELRVKLLAKTMMPGVSKSLSKGNPIIQAISSSVYALFTHPYTRTSISRSVQSGAVGKLEKITRKYSILSSLYERTLAAKEMMCDVNNIELELSKRFPLHSRYIECLDVISSYSDSIEIKTHPLRNRKNYIRITPNQMRLPLTMLQVVGRHWFAFSVRCSAHVYDRCLNYYKSDFPWLSDTIEESLTKSPFNTFVELHGFISGQNNRVRNFFRTGPIITSSTFVGKINQLARKCSLRDTIFVKKEDPEIKDPMLMTKELSKLGLSLSIPLTGDRVYKTKELLKRIANIQKDPSSWLECSKRIFNVGMVSLFHANIITSDSLQDLMKEKGEGIIIVYTHPQRRLETGTEIKWVGPGECVAVQGHSQYRVVLNEEYVTKIYVNNWDHQRRFPSTIREILSRINCTAKNIYNFSREEECVAKFDGVRFNTSKGSGFPIIVESEMTISRIDLQQVRVYIGYNVCSITHYTGGRNVPLLSFRTSLRDISGEPGFVQPHADIWDYWINRTSLEPEEALEELRSISKFVDDKRKGPEDRERLKYWSRETFIKRLEFKGLAGGAIMYSDGVEEEIAIAPDDDELDGWLEDILVSDVREEKKGTKPDFFGPGITTLGEIMNQTHMTNTVDREHWDDFLDDHMHTSVNVFDPEDESSPLRAIMNNWDSVEPAVSRSVINRELCSYLYLHELWDGIISFIHEQDRAFFTKMTCGIKPRGNEELSAMLMNLFDIPVKRVEPSIEEQLSRRTVKMSTYRTMSSYSKK